LILYRRFSSSALRRALLIARTHVAGFFADYSCRTRGLHFPVSAFYCALILLRFVWLRTTRFATVD